MLSDQMMIKLDASLIVEGKKYSQFRFLKEPPGLPSPKSILNLIDKLNYIKQTGILNIDLSWLSNNYQRALTRYAQGCSADRVRQLKPSHRYAVLVCLLWQLNQDTIDFMIDMYDKLITKTYNHAQTDIDEHFKSQRKRMNNSFSNYITLLDVVLEFSENDLIPAYKFYSKYERNDLIEEREEVNTLINGKYNHKFNLVTNRYSYLRQFSPDFLESIHFKSVIDNNVCSTLLESIDILCKMNNNKKRKLPDDIPLEFIPKKIRPFVESNGIVDKKAWECSLLTQLREEIKAGNIYINLSKRFGRFDDFFIPDNKWRCLKKDFFNRSHLPENNVENYLKERLNQAFDLFFKSEPNNKYAKIKDGKWDLSTDPTETLDSESEKALEDLKIWLSEHIRTIKLPQLLIEVDNELQFTNYFLLSSKENKRQIDDVREILATILAHGCNGDFKTFGQSFH